MNMSFLLAGSTSVNPIMFAFTIGLILAWKVAGYYGVDRYLLPRLGVPWGPHGGEGRSWPAPRRLTEGLGPNDTPGRRGPVGRACRLARVSRVGTTAQVGNRAGPRGSLARPARPAIASR